MSYEEEVDEVRGLSRKATLETGADGLGIALYYYVGTTIVSLFESSESEDTYELSTGIHGAVSLSPCISISTFNEQQHQNYKMKVVSKARLCETVTIVHEKDVVLL